MASKTRLSATFARISGMQIYYLYYLHSEYYPRLIVSAVAPTGLPLVYIDQGNLKIYLIHRGRLFLFHHPYPKDIV